MTGTSSFASRSFAVDVIYEYWPPVTVQRSVVAFSLVGNNSSMLY
jgi:hypothetical protein